VLACSIRDDGGGFDSSQTPATPCRKGLGVIAMQERVSGNRGTLRIESRPGKEPSFPSDFHWRPIMPIRIVLADDHVLVRQGLKSLLEREKFRSWRRHPTDRMPYA